VSLGDVIHAPFDPDEGFPTFREVLSKSGNRTVRVIFDPPVTSGNSSDAVLKGLPAMGCSYEGANAKNVAVNIPPLVDLSAVRGYLIEREVAWEHSDPLTSNSTRRAPDKRSIRTNNLKLN
jgi:Domain of unknown function (DUF4265)